MSELLRRNIFLSRSVDTTKPMARRRSRASSLFITANQHSRPSFSTDLIRRQEIADLMSRVEQRRVERQSRKTRNINRCLTSIRLMCCLAGILYQVYASSLDYFAYSVVSEVTVGKPDHIVPPAFSLCFANVEMIDFEPLLGKDFANLLRYEKIKLVQETVTIADIFRLAPRMESLMTANMVWARALNSYSLCKGLDCVRVLHYLKNYGVCFRFVHFRHEYSINNTDTFQFLAKHLIYGQSPGGIMQIALNRTKVNLPYKLYIHFLWFC